MQHFFYHKKVYDSVNYFQYVQGQSVPLLYLRIPIIIIKSKQNHFDFFLFINV